MQQSNTNPKIIGNYQIHQPIGKGTFGKVYRAIHLPTNCQVAIKMLNKQLIKQQGDFERVSRQIKILRKIRHKHVIQLYQVIETSTHLYLVIQLASHDLFSEIVSKRKLDQTQASNYFRQLLLGLQYCLSNNICHRDIKPENILISNGELKITDFGLSNVFQHELLRTACGSPSYAPPEMLEKKLYDPRLVDIWSSGVTLYAMVFGRLPFEDSAIAKLYQKIKKGAFCIYNTVSEELRELLEKILQVEPNKRMSIEDMLGNDWVNKSRDNSQSITEIDDAVFIKVCEIYSIDEKILKNDLLMNRHNNRTTTYYLSCKVSQKGRDIRKNSQDNSIQATEANAQIFVQSLSKLKVDNVDEIKLQTSIAATVSSNALAEEKPCVQTATETQITFPELVSINIVTSQKQNTSPNQQIIQNQNQDNAIKIDDYSNQLTEQQDIIPRKAPQSIKYIKPLTAMRRVSRMKPQFMKRTATKLNQRSISTTKHIQTKHTKPTSFTKTSIARPPSHNKNISIKMINVNKKPCLMNTLLMFIGDQQKLKKMVAKIQNKSCILEYSQIDEGVLYVNSFTGNIERLVKQISKSWKE